MTMRLRKAVLTVVAAAVLAVPAVVLPAGPGAAYAAAAVSAKQQAIQVYVDGVKLKLDQQPIRKSGATLVPMKPIFTALKAQLTWIQQTRTIVASRRDTTVTLQLGASQAVVNGKSVKLQLPAQVFKGSAMVPLRFVGEAFGSTLNWDPKTNIIRIESFEYRLTKPGGPLAQPQPVAKTGKVLTAAQLAEQNDGKVAMIMTNKAQGSGVVVGDRWILTNYHVISSAKSASVYLDDGTQLPVEGVVVYDEDADLAVIQTKSAIGVKPVTIGNEYSVRKGDTIYAIGSPLGIQNTLSTGLVSNITTEQGIRYFQINAPIDHGSSGGGLFDDRGSLIGITTLGIDDTTASLNFAVSVGHVQDLLAELPSAPQSASAVGFPPGSLPESLKGASTDEIRKLLEDEFATVDTSQGPAELDDWAVTRDDNGWLVLSAEIDPDFYTYYADDVRDELRYYMLNLGSELKRMLPGERIQVLVHYEETLDFEPRGFAPEQVTPAGAGKWTLRYPVIDMQLKDKVFISVRT